MGHTQMLRALPFHYTETEQDTWLNAIFSLILLLLKWKKNKMVRPEVLILDTPGDFMNTSPQKFSYG